MVERVDATKRGVRWATFSALAAVGATLVYDRFRSGRVLDESEAEQEAFGSRTGRGEPSGGPSRPSRKAGYELTDANARSLALVMITSVALIAGGLAGVFVMFGSFQRSNQAAQAGITRQQRAPIDPPLPRLQAAPYQDIDAVLMEQSHRLTTYGWNSSEHKAAHIPIERAMQQVVGKPLDGAAQADAAGSPGTTQSFQANPAFNALDQQHKAPIRMQGEGRPMNVAPSDEPKKSNP